MSDQCACDHCNGTGRVLIDERPGRVKHGDCPFCRGTGRIALVDGK